MSDGTTLEFAASFIPTRVCAFCMRLNAAQVAYLDLLRCGTCFRPACATCLQEVVIDGQQYPFTQPHLSTLLCCRDCVRVAAVLLPSLEMLWRAWQQASLALATNWVRLYQAETPHAPA